MLEFKVDFDLVKWGTYQQSVVQSYFHRLLDETLRPHRLDYTQLLYRGGFGRRRDLRRLLGTGSDYACAVVALPDDKGEEKQYSAIYASPIHQVAREPWCRGFDPLYWALKGHPGKPFFKNSKHGVDGNFNPVNVIVAYFPEQMMPVGSDVFAFKNGTPSSAAVAAVIKLRFPKPFLETAVSQFDFFQEE